MHREEAAFSWNKGNEMGRGVTRMEMQGGRELSGFSSSSGRKAGQGQLFYAQQYSGVHQVWGLA